MGSEAKTVSKNHHRILYYNLLTSCKLHDHLADVNEEATEMYERLVEQLAKAENITEQLKAENQLLWGQRMNNTLKRVEEIVNKRIIYR